MTIVKRTDGGGLRSYTGKLVFPLDPREEDFDIIDIAHALSNLCRFGGHVKTFYSVAEHSVYVSYHTKPKEALVGLLHDASEAYLVDMPRPIKTYMPQYRDIEENLQRFISQKFGLTWPFPASVHTADNRILVSEMRDLMTSVTPWPGMPKAYKDTIVGLAPKKAEKLFLARYDELTKETV